MAAERFRRIEPEARRYHRFPPAATRRSKPWRSTELARSLIAREGRIVAGSMSSRKDTARPYRLAVMPMFVLRAMRIWRFSRCRLTSSVAFAPELVAGSSPGRTPRPRRWRVIDLRDRIQGSLAASCTNAGLANCRGGVGSVVFPFARAIPERRRCSRRAKKVGDLIREAISRSGARPCLEFWWQNEARIGKQSRLAPQHGIVRNIKTLANTSDNLPKWLSGHV